MLLGLNMKLLPRTSSSRPASSVHKSVWSTMRTSNRICADNAAVLHEGKARGEYKPRTLFKARKSIRQGTQPQTSLT